MFERWKDSWELHTGRHCPVSPETKVDIRYRNGTLDEGILARQRRWELWRDIGETGFDIVDWQRSQP